MNRRATNFILRVAVLAPILVAALPGVSQALSIELACKNDSNHPLHLADIKTASDDTGYSGGKLNLRGRIDGFDQLETHSISLPVTARANLAVGRISIQSRLAKNSGKALRLNFGSSRGCLSKERCRLTLKSDNKALPKGVLNCALTLP